MPFTLCLDVTLRVAAVPRAAEAAQRLQADFTELAQDARNWPFRAMKALAEGDVLVVRASLLEPIEDFYGADARGRAHGEVVAADVVLRMLNAHCAQWRALEVGDRPVRAHTQRVRRRFWTGPLRDPQAH